MSSPRELLAQMSPRSKKRKSSVGSEGEAKRKGSVCSEGEAKAVFVCVERRHAPAALASRVVAVTGSRAAASAACKHHATRSGLFDGFEAWAAGPPYASPGGGELCFDVEEHKVATAADFED